MRWEGVGCDSAEVELNIRVSTLLRLGCSRVGWSVVDVTLLDVICGNVVICSDMW